MMIIFSVTLPAPFIFKGNSYTQVTANTNGWISLGSTAPSSTISNPISSTANVPAFFAPLGMDLQNADSGTPELRWQQSGNEIIFQWKDVKRFTVESNTEVLNFQLRLNTLTGAIQFVYGAFLNVTTSTISPRVGIRAETNAYPANIFNRLVNTTIPSNTWATSAEGVNNSSTCRLTSESPAAFPVTGQTFTWTPADCSGFSCTTNLLPVGGSTINSASVNLSWNAVAGAINYKLYFGTSLPLLFAGNFTGTSATINNLIKNTDYLWYIEPVGFNCSSTGCESATTGFNSGCVAINCVANIAPANLATITESNKISLSWNSAESATAYDLYLGTTNPPTTLFGTFTGTSTTVSLFNNTYFWYVHPRLSCLSPATCAVNTTQFTVNFNVANDICAGAFDLAKEITAGSTTFLGNFEAANPAFCPGGINNKDIWFKFIATATTASVSVFNPGSSCLFDPGISIYSGTCNSLTCLGTDDAGSCAATNRVSLTGLTIGNTYYVRIFSTSSGNGFITLSGTNIGSTPLPLKLISFSGSKHSHDALLQWKTANEINVSRFEVERSNNGTIFSSLGTVAAFNQPGNHLYSYTDNKNANAESYFYRLKMIDKDGTIQYSHVIYLNETILPGFTVFPNPVKEMVTISGLTSNGTIRLIGMDGKVLQQQNVTSQNITLQMGKHPKGAYTIQYVSEEKVLTQKIIKQ